MYKLLITFKQPNLSTIRWADTNYITRKEMAALLRTLMNELDWRWPTRETPPFGTNWLNSVQGVNRGRV